MAMAKIPIFCRASSLEVLDFALHNEAGILHDIEQVAYCYVDELEGLVYVDNTKEVHWLKSSNKQTVQRVDALPPADEADPEVLYIYENVVYVWTGTEYRSTFYEVLIEVDNLTSQLNTIESRVGTLESSTSDIEDRISTFENAIDGINRDLADIVNDINALELSKANADNVYTKSEVDALLEVETPSGAMSIPQYVDTSVSTAVQTAQNYTDQQLEIRFV